MILNLIALVKASIKTAVKAPLLLLLSVDQTSQEKDVDTLWTAGTEMCGVLPTLQENSTEEERHQLSLAFVPWPLRPLFRRLRKQLKKAERDEASPEQTISLRKRRRRECQSQTDNVTVSEKVEFPRSPGCEMAAGESVCDAITALESRVHYVTFESCMLNKSRSFVFTQGFDIWGPNDTNLVVRNCLKDSFHGGLASNVFESKYCTKKMPSHLSEGGSRIFNEPNAGGSSTWSEVLSFEVLKNCFGASLIATELEIQYNWGSKITDYSCIIDNQKIGVSVTRLIDFNDLNRSFKPVFTSEDAKNILSKKLKGILASTAGVYDEYKWNKQILHVWVTSPKVREAVEKEYLNIPAELRSNTLVLITVAENAKWIF